jgi:threonine-phosphate decarboxylase
MKALLKPLPMTVDPEHFPMKLAIDRTHGGAAPPGVLDFSASINPLGPPPEAFAAYREAAALIARYPSPYPDDLAALIARHHRISPGNVVVGNGSTQLIHLLARTLRPRRPFVAIPAFSEFANAMIVAGVAPRAITTTRERGFALEIGQVAGALEQGADAIFIGRPNSPTGAMLSLGEAAAMAARCSRGGCRCVFDEAFVDFAGEEHSAIGLAVEDPRVIVLRSLTKMFAIPGLRLGYLVAHLDVAHRLRDSLEPWSVNVVAERVGLACLDNAKGVAAHGREFIASEREYLAAALASVDGITAFGSHANFLMLEAPEHRRPLSFAEHMLMRGIAVRDLRELAGCGPGMYRVAVRLREENERLIGAARAYFD